MNIFKLEIKRAFNNKWFVIASLLAISCVIYNKYLVYDRIMDSKKMMEEWGHTNVYDEFIKFNFYSYWLIQTLEMGTLYLIYFIGLFVSLPYGASYYWDKKSGIVKSICTRIDKRKYLKSKYLAVFISGGVCAMLPVIVDFFMAKLWVPVDFPYPETIDVFAFTEWHVFVIDKPYLSALIYVFVWFIFGGAVATISLLISTISDNFFTIQLTPFILILLMYYIPNLHNEKLFNWVPLYFLTLFQTTNPGYCVIFSVIIMSITYFGFYNIEIRKDVL